MLKQFIKANILYLLLLSFVIVYALDINENLLFIILLFSLTSILIKSSTNILIKIILSSASLFILTTNISIPKDVILCNFEKNYTVFNRAYKIISDDTKIRYEFTLYSLQENTQKFGEMSAVLNIDGRMLENLQVDIINANILSEKFGKIYYLQRKIIELELIEPQIYVDIISKPGTESYIYYGPETYKNIIYSDSVLLKLENSKCKIYYHTSNVKKL